jgi:hypothetical protein
VYTTQLQVKGSKNKQKSGSLTENQLIIAQAPVKGSSADSRQFNENETAFHTNFIKEERHYYENNRIKRDYQPNFDTYA